MDYGKSKTRQNLLHILLLFQIQNWFGIYFSHNKVLCQLNVMMLIQPSGDLKTQAQRSHVITQNIDRLHQRGGSQNVIELHGNIFEWFVSNVEKENSMIL